MPHSKREFCKTLLGAALIISTPLMAEQTLTANEIIARSDAIRNPPGSFLMTIAITQYDNGRKGDSTVVKVNSKPSESTGQYRSLVEMISPRRDRGKLVLRNNDDLWLYDPSSKASVRIAPQQRLLGQVSNGDVMSSNFALDYDSVIEGEERIRDGEKNQRDSYRLKLTSDKRHVTYPAIEYWVDKENFQPLKGKFYATSGRLLKVAYYRKFKPIMGSIRPSEVLIIDGLDTKKITRMQFSSIEKVEIPEFWFQRNWLSRHESTQ